MADCPICCEKMNRSTRKPVSCSYCSYKACRACNQQFILQSINEPMCMNCKVPWSPDFIWSQFTHVFYNTDLENHRARLLFEREKLLLPQTQHRLYCENLQTELYPLEDMVFFYSKTSVKPPYYEQIKNRIEEIRSVIGHTRIAMKEATKKVDTVVRGCPQENCKGFIMKHRFQCGICSTQLCNKCHATLTDQPHECKEEDVETAKILTTNTKPCPKCREMIFKIDGCDQMWCTICHTAFSWKTGEVEKNVHNPHYYEWMRRIGKEIPRADGDELANPCDQGRPPVHRISSLYTENEETIGYILAVHRTVGHIMHHEIPRIDRIIHTVSSNTTKENMRVMYLRNELSEDQWKKNLILFQKRIEKWTKIKDIMTLFNQIVNEQLNHLSTLRAVDRDTFKTFHKIVDGIRTYCNQAFQNMSKQYPMVPFMITEQWGVIRERMANEEKGIA